PVPCPRGTYGPNAGAVSEESCLTCPPQHYCPRPGLPSPLACGPMAVQPLSGQDVCICSGNGQSFQRTDGRCFCTIGYQSSSDGEMCVQQLYSICRNGKSRTQYGDCLDHHQWSLHCKDKVCQTPEDYHGYDRELGLCVCREPPGRAACGGLCRWKPATHLKLQCSLSIQVSSVSGGVLEAVFERWDSRGTLQCRSHRKPSRPVYIVQTTGGDALITDTQWSKDPSDVEDQSVSSVAGVLNPTTCLQLGDVLLFTVSTRHYPLYDIDNLYNTNSDFDWGALRLLEEELTLSWTPPTLFSLVFSHQGVYVFTLSSNRHKHMIMFQEYGWPEKKPIITRYRSLQLAYQMDDYASKGSRVFTVRKTHRNQQARLMKDSIQPDEFWDYEHQVDLEAFSSNTFYSLLLKQSLSVTARLGQLTTEINVTALKKCSNRHVKEMYQGVLGKLQLLHPGMIAEERVGEGYERMRKEMEKEVGRRRALASQLRTLLDNQLEVLRRDQQAKQGVYSVFTTRCRECTGLLSKISNGNQASCELHQQILTQRLTCLVDEMGELVAAECHRQGAWGLLGEGTGAKLLCPDTGSPDGSLRVPAAVHCDPVTGLMKPNPQSHMLLSSGHTMAVPPDYFIHPQTGRVLPIVGNVAYDPVSSTLVFTTDLCTGDVRKLDSPLLPFLPFPTSCPSELPLPCIRLKGLKPGHRLQLGMPAADPDTGVPVPTLAVTIHPQTGLVYPLGRLHTCPLSRLPQPIQIGYPMLDSRTGNIVLTVGVHLDLVTGDVQPVGGALLGEVFTEPLSGQMVRVGGVTIRAGQLVPHVGGYQALLDSKVLAEMLKALDLLKPLTDDWGSDPTLQTASKELEQAWERSLHCGLQLWTRFEMLLDWTLHLQQDGGTLGEMPLPASDMCLPALLGMEYLDPMGSGLSVPVLGCQRDPISGSAIPLAGTMEDPKGKGLVAIRYGAQAVDPVTGLLAPVVGARLDVCSKNIVPMTSSFWLMTAEQTDSVQVEALQREMCVRNSYWQQQRQREEDVLIDLDSALCQHLFSVTDANSHQVQWSGKQLKEAAVELQDAAQTEVQRRAAQRSFLALVLPPHALHILSCGDEEEWDQQCGWHSALMSGLDKLDVCMDQLQQDNETWTSQPGDWSTNLHAMDRELRHREIWEQCCSTQTAVDSALTSLHFVRLVSRLRANTAQYVSTGVAVCLKSFTSLNNYNNVSLKMLLRHHIQALILDVAVAGLIPGLAIFAACLSPSLITHFPVNSLSTTDCVVWRSLAGTIKYTVDTWMEENSQSSLQFQHKYDLKQGSPNFFLRGPHSRGSGFVDLLDAQWECEGELIPLDLSVLNPREFLVYQHGLFLIDTLHNEAEETLFVRRQRLQCVGGFSLMLLHCLSHIKTKDMSADFSPAFQRLFFKTLQDCLQELFQARLSI
uniref:Uncharacterized protein n=1 Tax=Poecilia formosa TaxID=48698 RepID=A0A087XIS7_POEFO